MFTCRLCRFVVPLDDTLITTAKGGCICLSCYLRTVEDHRPLPKDLSREVAAIAAAA
jgi:hypothetical protein